MTQLEQVMYSATGHITRCGCGARSDRHSFHVALAAASAFALLLLAASGYAQTVPGVHAKAAATDADTVSPFHRERVMRQLASDTATAAVRPFRVNVPEAALVDLRGRLTATRWPDKETVADQSQGVQLAKLQELVRDWGTEYDWRKAEAKLNALPQFMTSIDGLNIHFVLVRSRHPNALPLIIAHGWPGSVFEQIKLIGPLTDPTKYGGRAEDAFDVVIPSLPGFGFSWRPTEAGWRLERIGRAFDVLMKRLGYTRYVAQGGDWGAGIVQTMGRQAPGGLLGIHTNLLAAVPDEAGPALGGGPAPAGLSDQERAELFAAELRAAFTSLR